MESLKGLYPYLDDRLIRLFLNRYAESGNERLALAEMRADPIMNDIYPGIRGKTHGDKKLINPAPKAIINSNIKYYINLLFFIRMNFMFLCS